MYTYGVRLNPVVGGGLGGLPKRKTVSDYNQIVESETFDISLGVDASATNNLSFIPKSPENLDIIWQDKTAVGAGGYGANRVLLIPFTGVSISHYMWENSVSGTYRYFFYNQATNAVTFTTSGTVADGSITVLHRDRVVKQSTAVSLATSETDLGITIKNPGKTFVRANALRNAQTVAVNTYLDISSTSQWHTVGWVSQNLGIKITDSSHGISLGSSLTTYITEFF